MVLSRFLTCNASSVKATAAGFSRASARQPRLVSGLPKYRKTPSVSLTQTSFVHISSKLRKRGHTGLRHRAVTKSELESEKLKADVREGVLDAISSSDNKVTVGDVASRAGLKVETAEAGLRAVAADTQATLRVSDDGDVVYVFNGDPRAAILSKSWSLRMQPVLVKAKAVADYLIRVIFGTTLLASLLLVYTTIFTILQASSKSNSSDSDRGSSFGGFRIGFNPFDMFWYWDPYYYERRREAMQQGESMNFLESIFSFVFGDGDPNVNVDAEKWAALGALIRRNEGVVTAEELAPYVTESGQLAWDVAEGRYVDESFVVPVLQRFGGSPEVDDQGNLLYRFPDLQTTAGAGEPAGGLEAPRNGDYLYETPWRFSRASKSQLFFTVLLGTANVVGIAILASLSNNPTLMNKLAAKGYAPVVKFANSILPPLMAYGASFFLIPLVRAMANVWRNQGISQRNDKRIEAAKVVVDPPAPLQAKLLTAKAAAKVKVIRDSDIAFSSDRELAGQDVEGREFDRKMRELEGK